MLLLDHSSTNHYLQMETALHEYYRFLPKETEHSACDCAKARSAINPPGEAGGFNMWAARSSQ
jgi:hypothetical protein